MLVRGRVDGMASALRDMLYSLATVNTNSLNGVTAILDGRTRKWWSHRSCTCRSSVLTGRWGKYELREVVQGAIQDVDVERFAD